jgi:hypothetical protein
VAVGLEGKEQAVPDVGALEGVSQSLEVFLHAGRIVHVERCAVFTCNLFSVAPGDVEATVTYLEALTGPPRACHSTNPV